MLPRIRFTQFSTLCSVLFLFSCGGEQVETPTATPTPVSTPVQSSTPKVTSTPKATPTPSATATPEITPPPVATKPPERTPPPKATPSPKATPKATSSPKPMPTSTPEPTATPKPIPSPIIGGNTPDFVPKPKRVSMLSGSIQINDATRIFYAKRSAPRASEASLQPLAEVLASELEILTGFAPQLMELNASAVARDNDIVLDFDALTSSMTLYEDEEDQSYTVEVNGVVTIKSQYYKGVAYGTATLLQAITEEGGRFSVPNMKIEDAADMAYRTVMIDVARLRHSIPVLKQAVRLARLYKVRYIQLHLTDDQNFTFPFTQVTNNINNNYTFGRQELKDLVRYADARGVTIIPEFDVPGHSTRLRQSGYLNSAQTDADVASPQNYARIQAIVDDMLTVFSSSPYFHIGGDESGAGNQLVPFLSAMNKHLRGKNAPDKKRMLVWEGFHGAPSEIPATGDDRVLVLSWESSYNPPWSLLQNNYQIINASWKPLYIVGHGSPLHRGRAVRMWSPETLYAWDADSFQHWEPGRPVYEDRGPNDPNKNDGTWRASYINRKNQVLGGQMLLWEQPETYVISDLRERLPAFAARLWNPEAENDYDAFVIAQGLVDALIFPIVSPIDALPGNVDPDNPMSIDYLIYSGDSVAIRLVNRSKIPGQIRFNRGTYTNDPSWLTPSEIAAVSVGSEAYKNEFRVAGGFGVRAQLFRNNGTAVDGDTLKYFNNMQNRVRVTTYDFGRTALQNVPDLLAQQNRSKIVKVENMPLLRGPVVHTELGAQLHESVLNVPGSGQYTLSAQSQSGRATVYIDLNKNGRWDTGEAVIVETPTTEQKISVKLNLNKGAYNFRVDHALNLPRPALILELEGPGTQPSKTFSEYLSLPTP